MSTNNCTAVARSPFWTPLSTLDRLNSWVRSEPDWQLRSALKPVIYAVKTDAILATSKQWHIGLRRVYVTKPCRACNGTGIWESFYDSSNVPCRTCGATGKVMLKFVETTIGPIRWHIPATRWNSSSLDVYVPFPSFAYDFSSDHYELADGWEPNQPGRTLTPDRVERDMLIILHVFPHHVAFALDYHHDAGIERTWNCPNVRKAEDWLRNLFHSTERKSNARLR